MCASLGYKLGAVLTCHGDNGAIFRRQFSANSIMIEFYSNFAVICARKHHTYSAREKIVIPVVAMTTPQLLMKQKRVCGFNKKNRLLSVNGGSKNAYLKVQSLDFKCHDRLKLVREAI